MKAHVLIIADGRSPTALSWINNIRVLDYQVSLISTYPCQPPEGVQHFQILPVAFSRFSRETSPGTASPTRSQRTSLKSVIRRYAPGFQTMRYYLGPLTLHRYAAPLRAMIKEIQPDLIHALRIPFEGMLGTATPEGIPFLAATWGNDLTLHARGSFLMRRFTRRCLERADGLTSDTHRDIRLAQALGLDPNSPTLVVPGSGGLDLDSIQQSGTFDPSLFNIPASADWVVNPRGLRPGSVHQDVFLASIPQVLARQPEVVFICPGLLGKSKIEALVKKYNIQDRVFLLPKLDQPQLWDLMRKSVIFVSPSSHDGTPNTLLEAMACGCFPVAGDIESLREWIKSGVNGLLVDPRDPDALAAAVLEALGSTVLRNGAAEHNRTVIKNRAARDATLPEIDHFYLTFLN